MITDATSPLTTASTSSTSNSSSSTQTTVPGALGKNDFMKLLIAQMQNQDPLNPADSSQYAAQLAQFSSLEQLQNLNDSMTQSINANITLTQSINNTLASNLIGKDVKLSTTTIQNSGQGTIQLGYNLPATGKSATISIYDQNNNLVKTLDNLPVGQGDHQLSWDFTDNNGNNVQQGNYTYKIDATDNVGKSMTTASAYISGTVDSIKFTSSGTMLVVGNTEYQLSDISEILDPSSSGGN